MSFGGLFFLAFLAAALFCFMKKKKKTVQETKVIDVDDHLTVHEAIMPGQQAVILSVEEDLRIHEEIKKNEGRQTRSTESSSPLGPPDTEAASPSHTKHHFLEHKA